MYIARAMRNLELVIPIYISYALFEIKNFCHLQYVTSLNQLKVVVSGETQL